MLFPAIYGYQNQKFSSLSPHHGGWGGMGGGGVTNLSLQ